MKMNANKCSWIAYANRQPRVKARMNPNFRRCYYQFNDPMIINHHC